MTILSFISACLSGKSRKNPPVTGISENFYDLSIQNLEEGKEIRMSDYKGKFLVIVNTASECGYTPQYKDLQEFYEKYKDSNIEVLGCPCNQFGAQEPGNEAQIRSFCNLNYGIKFPLSKKIDVNGPAQHQLYTWLTNKKLNNLGDFTVSWNFNKFIIGPDGKLVAYFSSRIKPSDKEFRSAVGVY